MPAAIAHLRVTAMRKRKLQIVFGCLGFALLVALIWLFVEFGTSGGDEARYRRLGRTARSCAWISSVDKRLPRAVARLIHFREWEMRYQDKYMVRRVWPGFLR